jgi:hypothetical protein
MISPKEIQSHTIAVEMSRGSNFHPLLSSEILLEKRALCIFAF